MRPQLLSDGLSAVWSDLLHCWLCWLQPLNEKLDATLSIVVSLQFFCVVVLEFGFALKKEKGQFFKRCESHFYCEHCDNITKTGRNQVAAYLCSNCETFVTPITKQSFFINSAGLVLVHLLSDLHNFFVSVCFVLTTPVVRSLTKQPKIPVL